VTARWLARRGVRRGVVGAASGLAVITVFAVGPQQASAEPAPQTIAQAKAQVAKLQQQAEAADQDFLALKEKLDKSQQDLKEKQADVDTQSKKVAQMREQVSKVALAQFQNRGLDARARLFLTRDPAGFLNQIATIEKVNENQNALLQSYQVEQANLADMQRSTQAEIATMKQDKVQLAALRDKADGKVGDAKNVLNKLTAEQRQAIADQEQKQADQAKKDAQGSNGNGASNLKDPTVPSSGKGAAVVAFAKAQIGKPYVFGATGPGSYDCSGLTSAAWRSVGVQLDRTSEAQFHDGTPVSRNDLQPGDLVFFYDSSAPSHVGIYVNNGIIIHAPRPGESVQYTKMSYMPYVGARRPA
jgi:peptidoglycan DL-endopeptidase CwlO